MTTPKERIYHSCCRCQKKWTLHMRLHTWICKDINTLCVCVRLCIKPLQVDIVEIIYKKEFSMCVHKHTTCRFFLPKQWRAEQDELNGMKETLDWLEGGGIEREDQSKAGGGQSPVGRMAGASPEALLQSKGMKLSRSWEFSQKARSPRARDITWLTCRSSAMLPFIPALTRCESSSCEDPRSLLAGGRPAPCQLWLLSLPLNWS